MPNYISRPNPYLEAANFGSGTGNALAAAMLKLPLQKMALMRQAQQEEALQQYRQANLSREQQRDEATAKNRQDQLERQQYADAEKARHNKMTEPNQYAGQIKSLQDEINGVRAYNKQAEGDITRGMGLLEKQDELGERSRHNKASEAIAASRTNRPPPPPNPLGINPSVVTALLKDGSPLDPQSRTNLAQRAFQQVPAYSPPRAPAAAPIAPPPSPLIGNTNVPTVPAGVTNSFPTPDHVKAAVKSGQLTPEQASDILQKQFGFTP